MLTRLASPTLFNAIAGRAKATVEADKLAAQVNEDQTQLEELAGMFARREVSAIEWRAARQIIEQRLNSNRRQLAQAARVDALDYLDLSHVDDLEAQFGQLDLSRQSQIVAAVMDHAVIGAGTPGAAALTRTASPRSGGSETGRVPADPALPRWRLGVAALPVNRTHHIRDHPTISDNHRNPLALARRQQPGSHHVLAEMLLHHQDHCIHTAGEPRQSSTSSDDHELVNGPPSRSHACPITSAAVEPDRRCTWGLKPRARSNRCNRSRAPRPGISGRSSRRTSTSTPPRAWLAPSHQSPPEPRRVA